MPQLHGNAQMDLFSQLIDSIVKQKEEKENKPSNIKHSRYVITVLKHVRAKAFIISVRTPKLSDEKHLGLLLARSLHIKQKPDLNEYRQAIVDFCIAKNITREIDEWSLEIHTIPEGKLPGHVIIELTKEYENKKWKNLKTKHNVYQDCKDAIAYDKSLIEKSE